MNATVGETVARPKRLKDERHRVESYEKSIFSSSAVPGFLNFDSNERAVWKQQQESIFFDPILSVRLVFFPSISIHNLFISFNLG